MRCELRIGAAVWSAITEHLHGSHAERMAYLLARAGRWTTVTGESMLDLLVVAGLPVPDAALSVQNDVRVEIDPEFTREILVGCFEAGLSLVDVHTHPFAGDHVSFSGHDVQNMRVTHQDFLRCMPSEPPVGVASLVLGRSSVTGSYTDPDTARLRPLTRFTVLGTHCEEVALCG